MYHSITIGEKNTWDDWHLIAKSRPFFNPPSQKTKYIEVPGSSGVLDLSNALTGYPVFNNREGSIDFTILNLEDVDPEYDYKYSRWIDIYTEMMDYLNGKTLRAVLEDEPDYYYEGTFFVSGYKPGDSASNTRGTITVSYNLNPYKWELKSSSENWTWDDFNFETGATYSDLFKDIQVYADTMMLKKYDGPAMLIAAVRPEITVENRPVYIGFENYALDSIVQSREFPVGTTIAYDFIIYGNNFRFDFAGPQKQVPEGEYEIDPATGKILVPFSGTVEPDTVYYRWDEASQQWIGLMIPGHEEIVYNSETGGFSYQMVYPEYTLEDNVYVEYGDPDYSNVSIDFKIGRL